MKIHIKNEYEREYREGIKNVAIVVAKKFIMNTPKTKTCTGCKIDKPLTAFRRANENPDGRLNKCKDCHKAKEEQQKAQQAEYAKNYFTF